MPEATKQPKAKFRAGAFATAVWENKGKKDDKEFSFDTIQLQRSYKVDEEWKHETINLRKNDVLNAILVLQKAHESIVLNTEKKEE